MQPSNELTLSQQTRKSNATKHPGLPDVPAKRRTHSEKLADDTRKIERQMMQNKNALHTLATIAAVEEDMEATQSAKHTATKKGVPPAKKRVSSKDNVTTVDIPKDLRE